MFVTFRYGKGKKAQVSRKQQDKSTVGQTDRQTDRQTDGQTEEQINKQADQLDCKTFFVASNNLIGLCFKYPLYMYI